MRTSSGTFHRLPLHHASAKRSELLKTQAGLHLVREPRSLSTRLIHRHPQADRVFYSTLGTADTIHDPVNFCGGFVRNRTRRQSDFTLDESMFLQKPVSGNNRQIFPWLLIEECVALPLGHVHHSMDSFSSDLHLLAPLNALFHHLSASCPSCPRTQSWGAWPL